MSGPRRYISPLLGIAALVALTQARGGDLGPDISELRKPPEPDIDFDPEVPPEIYTRDEFVEMVRMGCYNDFDGDVYAYRDGKQAERLYVREHVTWDSSVTHVEWVSK